MVIGSAKEITLLQIKSLNRKNPLHSGSDLPLHLFPHGALFFGEVANDAG
jgi:hypothetical protein